MKLEELIEKYSVLELQWRIDAAQQDIPSIRKVHVGVAQIFSDFQKELKSFSESHKAEIGALLCKAWECSVEMMEESFRLSNEPETHALTKIKNNAKALGYKYSAYKLREAFGFPKSEAPVKFNEKKEG